MRFAGYNAVRMNNGSMNLPSTESIVIDGDGSTVTVTQGSALKIGVSDGVDIADANTDQVYGYCIGFIVKPGDLNLPLELVSTNSTYVDGTYTAVRTGDTYASATDNVTDKKIAAVLLRARGLIVSGKLSADVGTTTGSAIPGKYMDMSTDILLDEATATTTSANYLLVPGLSGSDATDPAFPDTDDRRVLVVANELTGD